jgi:hypothetical protein
MPARSVQCCCDDRDYVRVMRCDALLLLLQSINANSPSSLDNFGSGLPDVCHALCHFDAKHSITPPSPQCLSRISHH